MRDVKAFSVVDIVKTTLAVYFNNLPAFLPLSLIVLAPTFLIVLLPESSSFNDPPVLPDPDADPVAAYEAMFPYYIVIVREGLVGMLCGFLLHAALAYGVVRHLRGAHAGFVASLVQFAGYAVAVLAVAVIVTMATSIGFLMLIVPGVWLTMVLWVALPALVVERSGLRAIARSAELTRGFRFPIFGLALILVAAQVVVGGAADWIVTAVLSDAFLSWCAMQFVVVVMSGIYATAVAVTYHDLRILKEGADTRSVATVLE
ncbi:MAG: hypothetical protein OXH15_17590 [Gammaproteobacteria bacterium]|nr:hypothetical protein [Gammaproteobacteria bacterium]